MTKQNNPENYFVLACPRDDGRLAILCRNTGLNQGPALCESKKDAVRLKTKLVNDPRGLSNENAVAIIRSLYVYELGHDVKPVWEQDSQWAYLPVELAKCVESQAFFAR